MRKQARYRGSRGEKWILIGDPHVSPRESYADFERFHCAGQFIADEKPDRVFCLGDLIGCESLSQYVGPKARANLGAGKSGENLRIADELSAFEDALKTMRKATDLQNDRHRRSGHSARVKTPEFCYALGNHDDRLDRFGESFPAFHGLIGTHMLHEACEKSGWKSSPFLEPLIRQNIQILHYVESGNARRPCGINQVLNCAHMSSIVGNSHRFGLDIQPQGRNRQIMALDVGSFIPPWRLGPFEWSGIVVMTDVKSGFGNVSQVGYDWLIQEYGISEYAQQLRADKANFDAEDIESIS